MTTDDGHAQANWEDGLDSDSASRILAALDEEEQAQAGVEEMPTFPGYCVDRLIGEGGSGRVYHAHRQGSDRPVAIKALRRRFANDQRSGRAWRELHVLSQLRLPAVPAVLDYGVHDDRLYFVTDFVSGLDLALHCAENDLGLSERVELLIATAEAVQSLHEHGVIHRDIKPSNILVNPLGQVVIIDLGVASLLTDDVTETLVEDGVPLGSPAFMAPEQADGRRGAISTRSDVYGLGATAYMILLGDTPHEMADTIAESIRRVAQEAPRDPQELERSFPRALAAVLLKAVSHQARERYGSAREFAEDLRRWQKGEPVLARGRSPWRSAVGWSARHPILVPAAIGLLIAASLIGSAALTSWRLMSLPAEASISFDGSSVRVLSVAGKELRVWDARMPNRIVFAEIVKRHPKLGGGRVLLLGLSKGGYNIDLFGEVVCFELDDLEKPAWSSADNLHLPELLEYTLLTPAEPDAFVLRHLFLEDVFPERPGLEIITSSRHSPYSASVIRVYDLAGEVLYEVWNDGHLSDLQWVPGSRMLVAAGKNSDGRWDERQGEEKARTAIYPTVFFAVKPQVQSRIDVLSWPGFEGTTEAAWYYCLLPSSVSDFIAGGKCESVESPNKGFDAMHEVQASIITTTSSSAGFNWVINAEDGQIVHSYETASWDQEPELPPISEVRLGALPARKTARK